MAKKAAKADGGAATIEAEESGSLLSSIVEVTGSAERKDEVTDGLTDLIGRVMSGVTTVDRSVIRTIRNAIVGIDRQMSEQLSAIMHHEDFTKLEGSWRGLHHLVMNSETGKDLKLKVLNATKEELKRDLDKAVDFDASKLFVDIHDEEFGMPGGSPYSCLIGDYEFSAHPEDVGLLRKISDVAAEAHCPFISGVAPAMFGMESFDELRRPLDIERIFSSRKYTQWKSFRNTENSRYCSLVMPRALARIPYGANTTGINREFQFEELPVDPETGESLEARHDQFCWMNAAYAYGTVLTRAHANTGWCTAIRGRENGGTIEELPVYTFKSDDGDEVNKCPTEIAITGRREAELSRQGFIPLCHYKDEDFSVFFGAQTCNEPKVYTDDDATANAAISARLPYIMAASRIAHYLKVIARDKVGSFMGREDAEKWLNGWIRQYVVSNESATAADKARFPLAEASIDVSEIPGQPGSYNAVAHLRPWLQLESLTATVSMVAKIPAREKT